MKEKGRRQHRKAEAGKCCITGVRQGIILILFLMAVCTGCSPYRHEETDTEGRESGGSEQEETAEESEDLAEGYREIYEQAAEQGVLDSSDLKQDIIDYLGRMGYAAVDAENQINMTNYRQVDEFCVKAGKGENTETTVFAVLDKGGFVRYDMEAENGVCDVIDLGRPLLADPDYCNKLRSGRQGEIRPCISCQEGCMGRVAEYSLINCAVNPQAARERFTAYEPVLRAKKVLIIGGGVAGCEAARVLATRGHKPEVYEKGNRLGGNLIPGGAPEFKEDDIALADWYTRELERLNVPVHLNTALTKDDVLKAEFDTLIVATGSTPKVFSLGDDEHVYTASQVLLKEKDCGSTTVVVGGGLVGCETALWLAQHGKKVTIVEALDRIMAVNGPLCHANKDMLEALLPFNGIDILTSAKVTGYADGSLAVSTENGEKQIPCDSVILSVGYKEENTLYQELEFEVPEIYLLGDAKKVSNIMYAIWDAFEVANHI